jgi:hypothetical protein
MIDNRYIEYLDLLIIPPEPFTLAIKKDGSKPLERLLIKGKDKAYIVAS